MNARALLLFFVVATAFAQEHDRPLAFDYRVVTMQIESLVHQKKFDAAREHVLRSLRQCPAEAAGRECRAHLLFASGYVYASRGDAESLPKAAQEYEGVLREDPQNPQALAALAEVFRAAGEAQRGEKQYSAAIDFYQKALETGALSAAPRLVSLLRTSDTSTAKISEIASNLRNRGMLSVAAEAYGIAFQREPNDEALAGWAESRALVGTLTADALPVPINWSSPYFKGLTKMVREGTWSFAWQDFRSTLQQYAAVTAAKAVADTLVERGEKKRALELLSAALEHTPRPAEQELYEETRWRPIIFLDIALQIARLATALKDKEKFGELEALLFDEKAEAYRSDNAASIQRMHTVLSTIYIERGEVTPEPDNPYANATFQLRSALFTAEQRETDEGIIQPLPHLHEWLARAYREQNDPALARIEELAAAEDYLDLDALSRAKASIDRARDAGAPQSVREKATALENIVEYRTMIPTLRTTLNVSPPNWSSVVLDAAFIERQKFKSYADLAGRAQSTGETAKAQEFSARAIEAGANQKLTGTDDALRAIRVQRAMEQKPLEKETTIGTVDYKKLEVKPHVNALTKRRSSRTVIRTSVRAITSVSSRLTRWSAILTRR
jgi:tetratricopeptide (TPR) repeat protein